MLQRLKAGMGIFFHHDSMHNVSGQGTPEKSLINIAPASSVFTEPISSPVYHLNRIVWHGGRLTMYFVEPGVTVK